MKRQILAGMILGALIFTHSGYAKESPDFRYAPKPGLAGRALLTENGFILSQELGTANFSPELRLPLQLIYDSSRAGEGGMFGHGWRCPQLESSVSPGKDGMTWTTPWGDQVGFVARRGLGKDAKAAYGGLATGRAALFAPHAEWEADPASPRADIAKTGDWDITGRHSYTGWGVAYRDGRLASITAPSGMGLAFAYNPDGTVASVSQSGRAFIEAVSEGGTVTSVKVNGIETGIGYAEVTAPTLPKTPRGTAGEALRRQVTSLARDGLAPVEIAYDANGYPARVSQGDFSERLEVEAPKDGKQAGRLLSDGSLTYAYKDGKPGAVSVTDKAGRTATYDFKAGTGALAVTDFAGNKSTYYYYMRHDVAYLGWLRHVVDAKGRTAASYRYDPVTARPTNFRDMAGNDVSVSYTPSGGIESVTRRGASQRDPEPVVRVRHDAGGNPVEVSRLDAKGRAVQSTRVSYNGEGRPVRVEDGRRSTTLDYNAFGYPVKVTDALGLSSSVEYDAYNRPLSATGPDGITTAYAWTPSGQIAKVERGDAQGVLTSLEVRYDNRGLPASMVDHNGREKTVDRDGLGRVIRENLPGGVSVAYAYDSAGRLTSVLDPDSNELSLDWSATGLDSLR
ncbi:MAG: hypothetical protein FWH21_03500, partial [Kiritimatiellaeota bacterium]|nr:hypothetical protein [Kiritimatiellota bacterium]